LLTFPLEILNCDHYFAASQSTIAVQDGSGKLPGIVHSVLKVRMKANAAADESDWALRPLSSAQTQAALQTAWFHAHAMDRLAAALAWNPKAMDACMMCMPEASV
jgi:ribonuclease D